MLRVVSAFFIVAYAVCDTPPVVLTPDGSVFVKSSIVDASRDSVQTQGLPADAANGAWVNLNSTGVNGNPPSIPKDVVLPAGSELPGQLVPASGNFTSDNSSAQPTLLVAENNRPGALVPAVSADNATVIQSSNGTSLPISVDQSSSIGLAASNDSGILATDSSSNSSLQRVARQADSTAFVSAKVDNVQSNQTFAVNGQEPIVAILPPGSNFTATWNASSSAAPSVVVGEVDTSRLGQSQSMSRAEPFLGPQSNATSDNSSLTASRDLTADASLSASNSSNVTAQVVDSGNAGGNDGFGVSAPIILPAGALASSGNLASIRGIRPVPVTINGGANMNGNSDSAVISGSADQSSNLGSSDNITVSNSSNIMATDSSSNSSLRRVARQADVQSNQTVTIPLVDAGNSNNNGGNSVVVPVILPAGSNADNQDLTSASGVKPIPIALQSSVAANNNNGESGSNAISDNNAWANGSRPADTVIIQQNHRLEMQIVEFEMNNQGDAGNQSVSVSARFTVGALPPGLVIQAIQEQHDVTPIEANHPALVAPESTTGFESVYSGPSDGSKIKIDHTLTADLCGQVSDKGILSVLINPGNNNTIQAGNAQQQSYTCALNLNFQTANRVSEANWSDSMPCKGANGATLWYRVRNYNIDWSQCQQARPNVAVA